jgi:hypothetical protein
VVLYARRARTRRRCSLDARSQRNHLGAARATCKEEEKEEGRGIEGARSMRAIEEHLGPSVRAPPALRGKKEKRKRLPLQRSGLAKLCLQFFISLHYWELGKLSRDVVRRTEKDAGVGGSQHGGVVVGVAGGENSKL